MADFYLAVKSTIDKLAHTIATELEIEAVELDDVTNVEEKLSSPDDLILFQLVETQPDPLDPLYSIQIEIGVKTTSDVGNYDLATLLSQVQNSITIGDTFAIRDYSTVNAPTLDLGYFYVTSVQTDPQAFDGLSGVRMQRIFGKVVRYF